MVIGFDYRLGGVRNGGIGRYAFELLNGILQLDSEGKNQYHIFHRAGADIQELKIFVKHTHAHLHEVDIRHYGIKEQLILPRELSKYKLDLMHYPNFNIPVFSKIPFVVTIHDLVHHRIGGQKRSNALFFEGYKYVINQAAKKSKHIITVSENSKKDIVTMLQVPADKVSVIYEGITLDTVEDSVLNEVRKVYNLERPYFLFVGVMERKKNLGTLIKGFELFLKKYNYDMDLVIAGRSDPHYPQIKAELLKSPARNNLVFTGYVDDMVLSGLYQGAYAFVNASVEEGFGLPGIEAAHFGIPIVVSDTPVFNEVYGNAGIFFDPGNPEDIAEKLYLICRDTGFHQQQQTKAFDRSEFFTWEKAAKETLEIYKNTNV